MIAKAIVNSLSQKIEENLKQIKNALELYLELEKTEKEIDIESLRREWSAAVAEQDEEGVLASVPALRAEMGELSGKLKGNESDKGLVATIEGWWDRIGKLMK